MEYVIEVEVDTGALFESVRKLENVLNASIESFGSPDKVVVRTTIPTTLSVTRELTPEEERKVISIVNESFARLNGRVVSFQKSGNVLQSASQSVATHPRTRPSE